MKKFQLGASPWPEIRRERIAHLLPQAMKAAQVDAWIVLCRENNNDPLADHIGGDNAGSLATFLFYFDDKGFHSKVFSPSSEAQALDEKNIHEQVISVDRALSTIDDEADFIAKQNFKAIAVNSSKTNAQADGLIYTQRLALEQALGQKLTSKLVSSEGLIFEWLSIKLPREIAILTEAATLSEKIQLEAYKQVIPNQSTDADIAKFIKGKMQEYGVTDAWASEQNPNVNSGADRGHSHSTDKVIRPGDVIQIDFGVKLYDRWVSDIQRFAYVLREGEQQAPKNIQYYWQSARDGGNAAFKAMQPNVLGIDVDRAQHQLMAKHNSEPVPWSTGYPVGYVAHDVGPNLGGSQSSIVRPAANKPLKPGMVFAFDGFHSWKRPDGRFKTISVEEMAVVTENGAKYLIPPQQQLILIKYPITSG